ncbi:MobF family relaxase [Ensifer aridi]|uniref:MobF family relaxase n=1 Tax=Ensifer aridi TaxID=1708715 RepID=UPI000A11162F|nr:MobF family relaxase [Ensifer aridi]
MSGTISRVKGFGYYEKALKVQDAEGSAMDYYDNENSVKGRWVVFTSPRLAALKSDKFIPFAVDGAEVQTEELQALTKGRHPADNTKLVTDNKKRSVAVDFTLSAPKSVSIAWGKSQAQAAKEGNNDPQALFRAKTIEACHRRAVRRAMEFAFEEGWIVTRSGKGGRIKGGAGHIAISQWDHYTTRAGDMGLHTHNVIANVCYREDGTTGAIDSKQLFRHKGEISALYRTELAAELKKHLGVTVSKDLRNFEIDGVPEKLITAFSKRRNRILQRMKERGLEGTADNRVAAQMANFEDRDDKSRQPPIHVLFDRWRMEAKAHGETYHTLWEGIEEAARMKEERAEEIFRAEQAQAEREGREVPTERLAFDLEAITKAALDAVTETEVAFEERKFRTLILEELQVHVNADEALAVYDRIKDQTELVTIRHVEGDPVYTTPELHDLELDMLRLAKKLHTNKVDIDQSVVERLVAKGRDLGDGKIAHYTSEQADLIKNFLSGRRLNMTNGDPGTGKSFAQAGTKEICDDLGFRFHALAPSWKAVDVLRKDTGVEEEYARAVTGWINSVRNGNIVVDSRSVICIDEFGMLGHRQVYDLLQIADETGCIIDGVGDIKQYQPVAGGAAMRCILDVIEHTEMVKITRQKVAWQLEASKDLSRGNVKAAFEAYDTHGSVKLFDDGDAAIDAAVRDFFEYADANPHKTQIITVATNEQAASVHERVNAIKIERGEVHGPSVKVRTLTFGKAGRIIEDEFQTGQRIVIGEAIVMGGERFANKLCGRIDEIKAGATEGQAVMTITWDDGRVRTFTTNELCGFRERGSDKAGVPKIAHADALTGHMSQGITVDVNRWAYLSSGSKEAGLVLKTRHRDNFLFYIDGGRIYDDIAAQQGVSINTSKKGGRTTEADGADPDPISDSEIKKRVVEELSKSQGKMNVSDGYGNRNDFVDNAVAYRDRSAEERAALQVARKDEILRAIATSEIEIDMTKRAPPTGPSGFAVRGLGLTRAQLTAGAKTKAEEDRDRMEAIAVDNHVRKQPKPKNAPIYPPMISDAEKAKFASENLHDYFLKEGAEPSPDKYVKKGSPITLKNGEKGTCWELRWGKGAGVVVTEKSNGEWVWMNRDRSDAGTLVSYVMKRDGVDAVGAWRKLRDELNTIHLADPTARPDTTKKAEPKPVLPELTPKEFFEKTLSTASDAYDKLKLANIKLFVSDTVQGFSQYLMDRAIPARVQDYFKKSIRLEPERDFSRDYLSRVPNRNRDGVTFLMTDPHDPELVTGVVRKGPRDWKNPDKTYSRVASDSQKNLVLMTGDVVRPEVIYIGENQIDPMSLWTRDGEKKNAWLASSAGQFGDLELSGVYKLAKENPQAKWVFVGQNDKNSALMEAEIAKAITTGNENAEIIVRRPPPIFKDWNEVAMAEKHAADNGYALHATLKIQGRADVVTAANMADLQEKVGGQIFAQIKKDAPGDVYWTIARKDADGFPVAIETAPTQARALKRAAELAGPIKRAESVERLVENDDSAKAHAVRIFPKDAGDEEAKAEAESRLQEQARRRQEEEERRRQEAHRESGPRMR